VAVTFVGTGVLLVVANLGAGTLNDLLLHLPGADKFLHFAFSLALLLLFLWALGRTSLGAGGRLAGAIAGAAMIGLVDELQQRFVAGRSVELADIGAGFSGVLVGVAWTLASGRPRLARVMAGCGLLAGGLITYESYLQTRDYNRGLLAERAGRREEALAHYRAAAAAGVRNPEAYNAAAWMILETGLGDSREAIRLAERSLAIRPDNPDALDTYGWALYRAGRAAEALIPLERALAAKPDIYCIHYHLGMAYLETGRRDEGVQHLRRQIEQLPRTVEARLSADVLARIEAPEDR
jgi:tetratricopeptide (TPR) repeat protein